jgi:penicillin-binding protein 2A
VVVGVFITVFVASLVLISAQARTFDQQARTNGIGQHDPDRNGKIFGQIYVENRETVPMTNCRRLINGVVAVEDAKFYQHHGFDWTGIVRAALRI